MADLYCRPCDTWWPLYNPAGVSDDPLEYTTCPECDTPLLGPPP